LQGNPDVIVLAMPRGGSGGIRGRPENQRITRHHIGAQDWIKPSLPTEFNGKI
jgi:hypothetical protein